MHAVVGVLIGIAIFAETICGLITLIAVPVFYDIVFGKKFKLTAETFLMLAFSQPFGTIFVLCWAVSDLKTAYKKFFELAEFVAQRIREKDAAHY